MTTTDERNTHIRYWIIAVLFIISSINYASRATLGIAGKPLAAEFHLDPVQLGYLFSAFAWSYALAQIHSMLALVRAGIGAALVPEAAQSLHFDDVLFRPVETDPPQPVELYAAWRTDNDNPALQAFLDLLRPTAEPEEMEALAASVFEPD